MNAINIVNQLVWPESKPADDRDRARARDVLAAGVAEGRMSAAESERRLATVATATTREDLYRALRGLEGGVPPEGLRTALRVATSVWLLTSVVQFAVWFTMSLVSGTVDAPWWLYSTSVGGVIVSLVWAANEAAHRAPLTLKAGIIDRAAVE